MPVVKPGKLNSRFEKNKKQYIHHYELHNIPWPFLAILCNDVLLVIFKQVITINAFLHIIWFWETVKLKQRVNEMLSHIYMSKGCDITLLAGSHSQLHKNNVDKSFKIAITCLPLLR